MDSVDSHFRFYYVGKNKLLPIFATGVNIRIFYTRVSTTYCIFPYPTYLSIDIRYCKIFCTILLHIDFIFIDIFCILGSLSILLTFGHLIFGHFFFSSFLLLFLLSSSAWEKEGTNGAP